MTAETAWGRERGQGRRVDMEEILIELAVFLAGAASGALLKYLQDRRLLHVYGELVRQLSRSLQEQAATAAMLDQERPMLLAEGRRSKGGQRVVSWPR
jgi:hypothetical protein